MEKIIGIIILADLVVWVNVICGLYAVDFYRKMKPDDNIVMDDGFTQDDYIEDSEIVYDEGFINDVNNFDERIKSMKEKVGEEYGE